MAVVAGLGCGELNGKPFAVGRTVNQLEQGVQPEVQLRKALVFISAYDQTSSFHYYIGLGERQHLATAVALRHSAPLLERGRCGNEGRVLHRQRLSDADAHHPLGGALERLHRLVERSVLQDRIVHEQQPIAWDQPSVELGHTARHQRPDHDQRIVRIERILIVEDGKAEAALAL